MQRYKALTLFVPINSSNQIRKYSINLAFFHQKLFESKSSRIPAAADLINRMEKSIWKAQASFKLKKESEFKDCLIELKNYCLQLDERNAERLSEASWNYLIQHFARQVDFEEFAIHCYQTIVIDKKIAKPNLFTQKAMLKCFSNQGKLEMCEQIFENLKEQNEYSLYTVSHYVNACIKNNNLEKALNLIIEMKRNGIEPNFIIFIPMLKAATTIKDHEIGIKMLELIENSNSTTEIQLSMCVIKFALQAKIPEKVIEACEKLKKQKLMDIVTWNCLIQAYMQMNQIEKSIQLIDEMGNDVKPYSTTFNILITACAKNKLIEQGKYLHNLALKLDDIPIDLWNSILNMYTKCNQPEIAIEQCKKLQRKGLMDVITWNCLIQAHIQTKQVHKAIQLLDEMIKNGVEPDSTTFNVLITACANNNLIAQGNYLHNLTLKLLSDNISIELATSIVNFYKKTNQPEIAIKECQKFQEMGLMDVITWNCFMQAYIQKNETEKAIQLLDEMEKNDTTPYPSTFNILITACANNNLLEQGKYLHDMVLNLENIPIDLWNSIYLISL